MSIPVVDGHIHLHEFSDDEIRNICGREGLLLLAVSDDLISSKKTIELGQKCSNVFAAVGLHPWEVGNIEGASSALNEFAEMIKSSLVRAVGEVGLDKKFVPQTYEKQVPVFRFFASLAAETGKPLSIHAAGAWREVLEVLDEVGVKKAVIHWFTGPLDLLDEIASHGYYIGVNAALKIQRKMREVVKAAPLEVMITESDGPYNYRGLRLGPHMIPEVIEFIAEVKGIDEEEVRRVVHRNFARLFTS